MMLEYQYPVIFLPTIDSTNLFAQDLINNYEAKHGTVIWAGTQNNGRGQRENSWISAPGQNLTFSIILFPTNLEASRPFVLNQVFSLGICDYLHSKGIVNANVKWPNDVVAKGYKLAGILLKNTIRGEWIHTIIAGIGLNVNQEVFEGEYSLKPSSIKKILGHPTDLNKALKESLHFIMLRYEQIVLRDIESLKKDYHNCLFKLNDVCTFKSGESVWQGVIRGVTDEGQLKVEDENGKINFHSFDSIKMIA